MNIYQNKTYPLQELLNMAETGAIAIPNIQRPYVWSPAQLARYIDSLMHGWPCGSLLLWNTTQESQNIFGTRQFVHMHETAAICETEANVSAASDYSFLILDGQQRMQSLVLAFSAATKGYCATLHEWRVDIGGGAGNRRLSDTKLLCFNLKGWSPETATHMPSFFYLDYEEEALDSTPCLQWRSEAEILKSDGAYIPLCRVPRSSRQYPEALAWLRATVERILNDTYIPVLQVNKLDHKVESLDDDEAIVQIFTRLNTAGTPLTKEQIQAARVKSLWTDFPEEISNFKSELSMNPYLLSLSDDDLVNGFNITLKTYYRTDNINQAYAQTSIQNQWGTLWKRFVQYTKNVLTVLQEKKLAYNSEYKSLYVLWFPVAHMCWVNAAATESTANKLVKWALVTNWAKIWANRSGQYVKSYTSKLIKCEKSVSTEAWLDSILNDQSLITAASNTIDNLAASHRGSVRQYYLPLWAWTRMDYLRSRFVFGFGGSPFAVDHIIPIGWVTNENDNPTYNNLGNCWILNSAANGMKGDESFVAFLRHYGMSIDDDHIPQLMDCEDSHLKTDRNSAIDRQLVLKREQRIKNDLKKYIAEDVELHFPNEEDTSIVRQYAYDTSNIFRGEEYVQTAAFLKLSPRSRSSYLSNIRSVLDGITAGTLENATAEYLQELYRHASEKGNCASAWRQYLNFLLGKLPRAAKQTAPAVTLQCSDIYRGDEFVLSPCMRDKGRASQQSYLSHVRSAMGLFKLTSDVLANMSQEEYTKMLDQAGVCGNSATGWRQYLKFLLGEEVAPRAVYSSSNVSRLNIQDIYMGEEYINSPEFLKLTKDSQKCNMTGIRKALSVYDLNADSSVWSDQDALLDLRARASERISTNYASYWRKYLSFLIQQL